jgi:hypothetical protein
LVARVFRVSGTRARKRSETRQRTLLPAALATGVGSHVQRSLATVVAGGLFPATLLTLFLVPTFYFVIERVAARRARSAATQTAGWSA